MNRLVQLVRSGVCFNTGFKEQQMKKVATDVLVFVGVHVTTLQLYNHIRNWGTNWSIIMKMKSDRILYWSEDGCCFYGGDEETVDEYIQRYPKNRQYVDTPITNYAQMKTIFTPRFVCKAQLFQPNLLVRAIDFIATNEAEYAEYRKLEPWSGPAFTGSCASPSGARRRIARSAVASHTTSRSPPARETATTVPRSVAPYAPPPATGRRVPAIPGPPPGAVVPDLEEDRRDQTSSPPWRCRRKGEDRRRGFGPRRRPHHRPQTSAAEEVGRGRILSQDHAPPITAPPARAVRHPPSAEASLHREPGGPREDPRHHIIGRAEPAGGGLRDNEGGGEG
ncbi:hypothetical protein QYE76_038881 [Lolium multiflorum]|uniref:Uncharacterized protein n=1 Tax=Lolium multiflorum TaxID=4521 RepID=A0AAD8WTZ5_LOLMU|nr:hypothetical protein QYE76_038881 [Lolium multiflorum]